jgi:hypothetical protein
LFSSARERVEYRFAPGVPDGLIAHLLADIRHGTGDSIVTPAWVLLCETLEEFVDLLVDFWPPWIGSVL